MYTSNSILLFNLLTNTTDEGQNFGAGFYNDHHFHFGYHIYAAAGKEEMESSSDDFPSDIKSQVRNMMTLTNDIKSYIN